MIVRYRTYRLYTLRKSVGYLCRPTFFCYVIRSNNYKHRQTTTTCIFIAFLFKIIGHVVFVHVNICLDYYYYCIIIISLFVILVVYREDDDVIHKFVRKIMTLPQLPAQHIQSMFLRTESLVPPNGKMCHHHYHYQWWI